MTNNNENVSDFTKHNVCDDNIISREQIGNYISYTCHISKSYIIFETNNDTNSITINNTDLDWNEPKLTINLLNHSLNNITKENNIKYFIHTIMKDEIKLLNLSKWEIIKDDGIIVELRCNIENCPENVLHGFVHNF